MLLQLLGLPSDVSPEADAGATPLLLQRESLREDAAAGEG